MIRPSVSTVPPGGNGTTSLIALSGNPAARTQGAVKPNPSIEALDCRSLRRVGFAELNSLMLFSCFLFYVRKFTANYLICSFTSQMVCQITTGKSRR
jgi:hypothetical protein